MFDGGDVFETFNYHTPDDCCAFCCNFDAGQHSDSYTYESDLHKCHCKTYAKTTVMPRDGRFSGRCPAKNGEEQPAGVEELATQLHSEPESPIADDNGQCGSSAYSFCCAIGTPCDCSKGATAEGQCSGSIHGLTSYAYCCGFGTPCDCSQPPQFENNGTVAPEVAEAKSCLSGSWSGTQTRLTDTSVHDHMTLTIGGDRLTYTVSGGSNWAPQQSCTDTTWAGILQDDPSTKTMIRCGVTSSGISCNYDEWRFDGQPTMSVV